MNADVAVSPPARPWSQTPAMTSLSLADSDPPEWTFPSLVPAQNPSRPGEPDPPPESQMDFFHKLGYSAAQVQAVQQKFGPNTDTDKVLGELVKIGAERGPVTTVSVLVPRGDPRAAGPTLQVPVAALSPRSKEEGGEDEDALRPVVIDGSNVAMSHGNKEVFSCLGIQLAVDFFLDRGHTEVNVFVPSWRKEHPRPDVPITDQHILRDLERRKILVFTPSRRVAGKRVVCNDDCFIVKLAYESDGVIVSNDMYRDLQGEKPEWKRFIEERLLMYSFVNNKFMPPDDPLGRYGPTLENFLRRFPKTPKKHLCPYGKKCTYGIKCKFHHPERIKQSNLSVADELRENAKHPAAAPRPAVPGQSLSLVEDMAKKLTLGHESGCAKKDPKGDHGAQAKTSHRSGKRAASRKEKTGRHSSPDHGGSQEQLDSGLGSIDSQPAEAPWSEYRHRAKHRSCQHAHSVRQQCCPPRSAPCSCCSHGPPAQAPAFQNRNRKHGVGPVGGHSLDATPYGPPHYPGYGAAYPLNAPANRHPVHIQQQQKMAYWSDPFGGRPAAARSLPGEHPHWETPQVEREVVRKKLLAIFSAHLVDTAMDMFPHVMDPQVLVAEILALQSQSRSLR